MKMNLLEYDMLGRLLQWELVHQLHETCVDKIQSEIMSKCKCVYVCVCVCQYYAVPAIPNGFDFQMFYDRE